VQGAQQFFWSEDEVNNRLIDLIQRAFRDALHVSVEQRMDMRMAAMIRGIARIKEAKRRRGVFP
jgi:glutamate dehydrogenase (NAD(P)+)